MVDIEKFSSPLFPLDKMNDNHNFLKKLLHNVPIVAIPFIFGITCHEVAHGYVSYLLGDPTAKNAGRLTLENEVLIGDMMAARATDAA